MNALGKVYIATGECDQSTLQLTSTSRHLRSNVLSILIEIFIGFKADLLHISFKNLPYGTLGPEGLLEYDIAAVYDILEIL